MTDPTLRGFGLSYIQKEGAPLHPDDRHWRADYVMSDELYVKQLQGYLDATGDDVTKIYNSRPQLLHLIRKSK